MIINLRTRTAEVHTNALADAGTYSSRTVVGESDKVSLHVGIGEFFEVPLTSLLP